MGWGRRYFREEVQKGSQRGSEGGKGDRVISLPLSKACTASEQLGDHRTIFQHSDFLAPTLSSSPAPPWYGEKIHHLPSFCFPLSALQPPVQNPDFQS